MIPRSDGDGARRRVRIAGQFKRLDSLKIKPMGAGGWAVLLSATGQIPLAVDSLESPPPRQPRRTHPHHWHSTDRADDLLHLGSTAGVA